MRAVYFLVVAATALLAGTTAASEDQTKLSLMTNTDAIQSLGDAQVATTKRFLRRKEEEEEEEDDSDDEVEDEDEEERGNLGALDDALVSLTKSKMTDDELAKVLTSDALNGAMKDPKFALYKGLFKKDVPASQYESVVMKVPRSQLTHNNDDVAKSFKWWSLFKKAKQEKKRLAAANAAV